MNKQGPVEGSYCVQDVLDFCGCAIKGAHARGWKAVCPFHEDVMPSMWIYSDTNTFYCFGCGAWGGPADVVVLYGHASTRATALEWLASHLSQRRAAPKLDARAASSRGLAAPNKVSHALDRLLQTGRYCPDAETETLGTERVRAYMGHRGFNAALMAALAELETPPILGSFPTIPYRLRVDPATKAALVSLAVLTKGGFLQKRLCPSVYFAIRDLRGVITGMQARSLQARPKAKYLFTKSYSAWSRSRSLFLLTESLTTWGCERPICLTEGPLDVLE